MTIIDATTGASLITTFTGVIEDNLPGLLLVFGTMAAIAFAFRKLGKVTRNRI